MSDAMPDMRDLAPAYALGALDGEEKRAFEAALATSPELQQEVAEYRELNAVLAAGQPATPAAELRERLLARVRAEKVVPLAARKSPTRPLFGILLGLGVAASTLLALGLGLRVRSLDRALASRDSVIALREEKLSERERTLNAILEPGTDLTVLTTPGDRPPGIQVFRDKPRNRLIIHAFRLAPAPTGQAYQLWILPKGGNPIPSRVFNSEADGHALAEGIEVPPNIVVEGFAITQEPAGGSPRPTSAILLYGKVITE
ncbi:MAG TPA: anti-sigma factor [Gemmatimonadales bacterium]|nr:anti-sigma factor [Gemmatimonadales bacterium]